MSYSRDANTGSPGQSDLRNGQRFRVPIMLYSLTPHSQLTRSQSHLSPASAQASALGLTPRHYAESIKVQGSPPLVSCATPGSSTHQLAFSWHSAGIQLALTPSPATTRGAREGVEHAHRVDDLLLWQEVAECGAQAVQVSVHAILVLRGKRSTGKLHRGSERQAERP
eukprot:CAMPEP_0181189284 /NCGR_PEP_ID=MMETSP1096-20121128/11579_1 /TAXON_ID=156174 ORGANISM="Chrysochromulina ericina, Strain CCMP281" /NCGR_SAMPLE_ID=MMETSP1096 /ASSEMBLY_ACC=CAM_ASM_000453 /LENGTH=167 /DNA_ID=CAMNT_0023278425 /DNA_START=103 /DNA_END=610 /DNA_ORIENTATION=+